MQVANAMTCTGELKPVSRHGLNRPGPCGAGAGPMMKCSFEETSDVLTDAALFSESDDASGVTSSVMNGERARGVGTGCFDIIMPTWCLPSSTNSLKAPQRKLAKSKVRTSLAVAERRSVELINEQLWTFRHDERASDMQPFCDEAEGATSSGAAMYAAPAIVTNRVFVPSSPSQLIT